MGILPVKTEWYCAAGGGGDLTGSFAHLKRVRLTPSPLHRLLLQQNQEWFDIRVQIVLEYWLLKESCCCCCFELLLFVPNASLIPRVRKQEIS